MIKVKLAYRQCRQCKRVELPKIGYWIDAPRIKDIAPITVTLCLCPDCSKPKAQARDQAATTQG